MVYMLKPVTSDAITMGTDGKFFPDNVPLAHLIVSPRNAVLVRTTEVTDMLYSCC
jgi:hypothetical protein